MQAEKKRLMSFYKLISVVGIAAVIAPLFQSITLMLAGEYSYLTLLLIYPPSLALGYACQWMLLGKQERRKKLSVDFNFEQKNTLSRGRRWAASLLAAVVGAVYGLLIMFPTVLIIGVHPADLLDTVIPFIFAALSALGAFIGVRFCGVSFNRLLGIRSLIECSAAFAAYIGFGTYVLGGVSSFLFVCVAIYTLCLMIEMNQESVLQMAGSSDTCLITPQILRAGILSILAVWGRAFLILAVLLGVLTFLVVLFFLSVGITSFRMQTAADSYSAFELIFYGFPTQNATVNSIFFLLGVAVVIVSIVLLFRRGHQWQFQWTQDLHGFFARFLAFLRRIFVQFRYRKKEKTLPSIPLQAPYTDKTERVAKPPVRHRRLSYAAFARRLRSLPNIREQFSYAYRTLIALMVQKEIGVKEHHTPLEASRIICEKTNYAVVASLTELFLRTTYAREETDDGEALANATQRCCEVLQQLITTD